MCIQPKDAQSENGMQWAEIVRMLPRQNSIHGKLEFHLFTRADTQLREHHRCTRCAIISKCVTFCTVVWFPCVTSVPNITSRVEQPREWISMWSTRDRDTRTESTQEWFWLRRSSEPGPRSVVVLSVHRVLQLNDKVVTHIERLYCGLSGCAGMNIVSH